MIIARALENIYIIPAFRAACRFCTWFQRFNARDTRDAFHYMNSGRAFKSLTNAVSYIFLFIFIIFWIREIFRTFTNVIYVIFPQAKARFPRFSFHATWRSIDVIIKIKGWYTYPDRMVYLARLGEIVAPRVCVYMNVCICICVCINHISKYKNCFHRSYVYNSTTMSKETWGDRFSCVKMIMYNQSMHPSSSTSTATLTCRHERRADQVTELSLECSLLVSSFYFTASLSPSFSTFFFPSFLP